MKRILFLSAFITLFTLTGNTQVNPHAIGLRSGSNSFGYGGEVTYQHGFGDANRLELDFGLRINNGNNYHNHLTVTGIYHWVWNLTSGLNWYVGPGAQVGLYNNGVTFSAGGQVGLEYDFNELSVPILLSLDTRPMIRFIGGNSGFGYGGALSIRYTF